MRTNSFAVKRGRTFTTFSTAQAARIYWANTIGGVFMIRKSDGKWGRL